MIYKEIRHILRFAITNYYLHTKVICAIERGFVEFDKNDTLDDFYEELERIVTKRSHEVYDTVIMTDKIRDAFIEFQKLAPECVIVNSTKNGFNKQYLIMPWLNDAFDEHNAPYSWIKHADRKVIS